MTERVLEGDSTRIEGPRGDEMRTPDEVAAMLRLWSLGWGAKRIASELGVSRNTVRRYIESGGWAAYRKRRRAKALDGLDGWLAERMRRHRGNADVVRQDLSRELGLIVSLRTVECIPPARTALADFRRTASLCAWTDLKSAHSCTSWPM